MLLNTVYHAFMVNNYCFSKLNSLRCENYCVHIIVCSPEDREQFSVSFVINAVLTSLRQRDLTILLFVDLKLSCSSINEQTFLNEQSYNTVSL